MNPKNYLSETSTLPPHQQSCRSVMFSVLPVCHYISSQRNGPNVATTHDTIGQSQVTWDPSPSL